ncbi:MAG: N-(5'-phosphoribosyl)anthranilate isomerase, partial [Candidatus Melainabacteria bacterium]|nr:N-(5'-phosphoribosyl)anthranilate isomerase [Candidatus Melainabacteria bacterium]
MSTKIKICGITSAKDALAAIDAGADFLGLIFVDASPRCVKEEAA